MSKKTDVSNRWIRQARNRIAKETAGMTSAEYMAYIHQGAQKALALSGYVEVPNGDGTFKIQPKDEQATHG